LRVDFQTRGEGGTQLWTITSNKLALWNFSLHFLFFTQTLYLLKLFLVSIQSLLLAY
jgi:hypothetical protein